MTADSNASPALIAQRIRNAAGGPWVAVAVALRAEADCLSQQALARLDEAVAIEEAMAWRILRGEPPAEEDGLDAEVFLARLRHSARLDRSAIAPR